MMCIYDKVESNPYCQLVLKARIKNKCLHEGRVYGDVKAFNPASCGVANLARGVIGGFPCQAR